MVDLLLQLEDMLDELGGPDAEAPAPEPELVVKLCPEPRVFVLEAFFNWTAARHPVNYPQNASWSPMFGAVHNEKYVLREYLSLIFTFFPAHHKT